MAGSLGGYPGPTIVAYRDQPVTIRWQNHVARRRASAAHRHDHPIWRSRSGGHSKTGSSRSSRISTVGTISRLSTALRSSGSRKAGAARAAPVRGKPERDFVSSTMEYLNDQRSATLWYHDHALGITRLNVYAGLAGFYVLQDDERLHGQGRRAPRGACTSAWRSRTAPSRRTASFITPHTRTIRCPGLDETVGDVVPQAFYDEYGEDAPSIVPEFFGDTILVNGMAWPNLDVAAVAITFGFSTARTHALRAHRERSGRRHLSRGYRQRPAAGSDHDKGDGDGIQEPGEFILLAPGDRVELVFDFSKLSAGETVRLLNSGPLFEPFKGVTADGQLLGRAEAATPGRSGGQHLQFTVTSSITPFHRAAVRWW